ncbi:MAG: hypothetical protein GKR87_09495 [Kiritimatiellae bacterium]|nr:hypothetical protein [Kiritimatiellia bacterium]
MNDGVKSALELAMERLDAQVGKVPPLSEEQKEAIAQIENETKAKVAEVELVMDPKIGEARKVGAQDNVQELEASRLEQITKARAEGEKKKSDVRGQRSVNIR